ncbi:hypothetical protein [Aerococcus sp. UMB7834]|uniref:hypothetical protein n=1 Tax=Aerococcus sp. UMB7834 TaxID=3046342 RepID=UPI00254B5E77|nr:hypothetical protein [Aerococcus sp. UMB7834]MDK6805117.1 hypothetical protein [Aerococcus sp. UMB7834]
MSDQMITLIQQIENLIYEFKGLQDLFYNDWLKYAEDLRINFKSKQINHIVERDNESISFFEYIGIYYNTLSELNFSSAMIRFNENYSSLCLSMRIKTMASIQDKIDRYYRSNHQGRIPINKCLNDLFGIRIFTSLDLISSSSFKLLCEDLKEKKIISRYYVRKDGNYRAIHIYIKPNNYGLPWELQIWFEDDKERNYLSHSQHKQDYIH